MENLWLLGAVEADNVVRHVYSTCSDNRTAPSLANPGRRHAGCYFFRPGHAGGAVVPRAMLTPHQAFANFLQYLLP